MRQKCLFFNEINIKTLKILLKHLNHSNIFREKLK